MIEARNDSQAEKGARAGLVVIWGGMNKIEDEDDDEDENDLTIALRQEQQRQTENHQSYKERHYRESHDPAEADSGDR